MKLLLMADDFTGALDTGIPFAEYGAVTKLLTAEEIGRGALEGEDAEVLIVDTETRHLTGEKAYQIVYNLTKRAVEAGIPHIYKKTDSGLRGNIDRELNAVLDASGESFLAYLPALPQMNRITVKGTHYVNGVPIAETEFGQDPFEPVKSSRVCDLFGEASASVRLFERQQDYPVCFLQKTIGVFDSETQEDIVRIAETLKKNGQLRIMAGCVGFASALPEILGLERRPVRCPALRRQLLIACGSMNPITRCQIEYGETVGYRRVIMTPRQQLEEGYLESEEGKQWIEEIDGLFAQSRVVMIDTGVSSGREAQECIKGLGIPLEQARERIAGRIGSVLKALLEKNSEKTLMIVGGDTLMGFVSKAECREITPVCQMEPGTVLSSMKSEGKTIWVITKSGGFGKKELFRTIMEKIDGKNQGGELDAVSAEHAGNRILR